MRWLLLLVACGAGDGSGPGAGTTSGVTSELATADVVDVTASGSEGAYTFAVAIRSDETGCDRYSDWWEVITPGGDLVYRRILDHSHPTEQPFTRTGGPISLLGSDFVVIRAHLEPGGYVGEMMEGSVDQGFAPLSADSSLFPGLANSEPNPEECLF